MSEKQYDDLAEQLFPATLAAGRAIMEVYQSDFSVDFKNDNSPVTKADQAAEEIILAALSNIAPDIPVIAEEAASKGDLPSIKQRFFLVDPLDGTKEFIQKSHEFTVNIALIEQHKPVFGIVYAPSLHKIYLTLTDKKAVTTTLHPDNKVSTLSDLEFASITTRPLPDVGFTMVASKSHITKETSDFIAKFSTAEIKSMGSSLKLCLLASGQADLYPRFGPTMEWDIAAGHAILAAAGGLITGIDGQPFLYGTKEDFLNPPFIAWGENKQAEIFFKSALPKT